MTPPPMMTMFASVGRMGGWLRDDESTRGPPVNEASDDSDKRRELVATPR